MGPLKFGRLVAIVLNSEVFSATVPADAARIKLGCGIEEEKGK
jgi:hypothetical protein